MTSPRSGLSRLGQPNFLLCGNVALCLIVVAATAWLVLQLRDQAMIEAARVLRSTSLILADQAERAFESVDLVQAGLIERANDGSIRTRAAFRARMSGALVGAELNTRTDGLPQLSAIAVVDAYGAVINHSDTWSPGRMNVADRDYFKAFQADASPAIFIGQPAPDGVDGIAAIVTARKVTDPDGRFLGLVLAELPTAYFERLYRGVAPGPGSAISLFRRDGVLLARDPHPGHVVAIAPNQLAPIQNFAAEAAEDGIVRHVGLVDGVDRLASARALRHYPLFITASNAVDDILADWREQALYAVLSAGLLELMIIAAGLLMRRQLAAQRLLAEATAARARAEAGLALAQERERGIARARHQASHDTLTGLPNRRGLRERLAETGWEAGQASTLLFVDIDGAKAINDQFGHAAGDALLTAVAGRLNAVAAPDHLAARLGGDEFAVLCATTDHDAVAAVAERIRAAVDAPFAVAGDARRISATVGVAAVDADAGIDVLDATDMAISSAKTAIEARRGAEANRQKMEALGRMMGGVAHEINNMLQPITLLARDVIDNALVTEAGRPHLDIMVDCGQKARQIIGDLLAFARPTPRATECLDSAALLRDTLRLVRQAIPPGIALAVEIAGTPPPVRINRTAFSQILLNLATNAAAAMEGRGTLTVALDDWRGAPGAAAARSGARLRVIDTGHGMSKATLERVFEPFFTTKPVGEGTGLGLSVVFGLVSELGGSITLESVPEQGTTVSVFIPGHVPADHPLADAAA